MPYILAAFSVGLVLYLIATYEPTKIRYMSKKESEARKYIVNVITAKKKGTASPEMIRKAILLATEYKMKYEVGILRQV